MKLYSLLALSLLIVPMYLRAGIPPVWQSRQQNIRKDKLSRIYVIPQRIVWMNGSKGKIKNEEFILKKGTGQPEMGIRNTMSMRSFSSDTASILFDYGLELQGGIHLVMNSSSRREPSLIRIRFGESVQECNSSTNNSVWAKGFSTDDHAMRDILLEIPRDGQIEIGNTGFRFVRIDLLQLDATVNFAEISAIMRYRDIPYLGSFHCNDSLLNKIWMIGAYTVHLNMQEYLWDGIKRDRLIWLGDMHPEVSTICSVFGFNDVVPKSLDLACLQFPLPSWMNGMTSYSMWYLIIMYEWWMQNGDINFLNKHRDYIIGLVHQIDHVVNKKGQINGNYFLDWPSSSDRDGVNKGVRALLIWAMRDAIELCKVYGDYTAIATCNNIIHRVHQHLTKPDSLKQAAALMALSGEMKPKVAFNDYLVKGHASGFSTFYGYYMLIAEALAGQYEEALNVIRQFWGGMIHKGATTFWEDFDLSWMNNTNPIDSIGNPEKKNIHGSFGRYCYLGYRCSLCHGWASGPTPWLSHYVLGVRIEKPGCKVVHISPHLGDLKWVEGTYPTPYGIIKIRHEKKTDGTIHSVIVKPSEVEIVTDVKDSKIL
jgi:hypothetical protein